MDRRSKHDRGTDDVERIYRERVDSVPDWIWDIDTNGTYTFSNSIVENILGYTASEIVGKNVCDFIMPEDATKCMAAMTEAVRTKQPIRNIVHRFRARDGNPKTLESSSTPIVQDGALVGFRGISRDIVDELIFQRVARETMANYRAALENAPSQITIIQGDHLVYRNPRIYESSGYTDEELSTMGPFSLVHPDDIETATDMYKRAMLGEAIPTTINLRTVTKSGDIRWLEVRATVITYNGAPALLGNAVDVTDKKLAQDTIRESEERLQNQQASLPELTRKLVIATSDLDAALREITENASCATDVERLSVWIYSEDRAKIICLDLFELSKNQHSSGQELTTADYPKYFEAIEESRALASDASVNEHTQEFADTYLRPNNIISMMDAAIRLRGQVVGMVCFEHTGGPRHWHPDEENFAAAIANLTALAIETSNRATTEESLRVSEARYRLLFERSPDMVCVVSNDRFVAANPASFHILGLQPSEIIGLTPWDISPEFQPDGIRSKHKAFEMITHALKVGPHTFPWVHKRKDGTNVDCEVSLAAYNVDDETYVQAIVRDVTERKKAEDERRALERCLEDQKRLFYRETILSVTDGKLDICDESELQSFIANASMKTELHTVPDVPEARHSVEKFCRENGLEGDELSLFISGVGEAITNAFKHGEDGNVCAGKSNGDLWVTVTDQGHGIASLVFPRAVLERGFSTKSSLGLGFTIMLDVADQIMLSTGEQGTIVVLIKTLDGSDSKLSVEQIPDRWDDVGD